MRICIDARYVFPKMDGIGRYLINLIDTLSLLTKNDTSILFFILEVEEFANNSLLRKFDGRDNLNFIKIPVKPLTFQNHFVKKYLNELNIDIFHYPQFDLPFFLGNVKVVTTIHDLNPQKFDHFFPSKLGWIKKYYSILTNWTALKDLSE